MLKDLKMCFVFEADSTVDTALSVSESKRIRDE